MKFLTTAQRPALLTSALLLTVVIALPTHAQHTHGQHAQGSHQHGGTAQGGHQQSPYSGMQSRTIKALSEQQLADLRSGKGMSFALPAELNGYPGPSHALELAEPLKLSSEQASRTRALFEQMQRESAAAGEAMIEAEAELDALFRNKGATPALLTAAVGKAAQAQGTVRETHLRYHLRMMEVLTSEQVAAYNRLRGY